MAEDAADDAAAMAPPARSAWRRAGCIALLALLGVVIAGAAFVWLSRERIAGNYLGSELAKRGIHATYKIEQISTRTQILRDVVVGDPAHPDLTIARAIVRINPRFGLPTVGRITLIKPRLYGAYRDGKLTFGELDPLLFLPRTNRRFTLPDINLAIDDGRALVRSDHGDAGIKLAGQGNLQDGFAGEVGAVAPHLALGSCAASDISLYGRISIARRTPRFEGPVRFSRVACPGSSVALRSGAVQLRATADEALRKFDGTAVAALGPAAFAQGLVAQSRATARFTWRDGGLTSDFNLAGSGVQSDQLAATRLELAGTLRTRRGFERIELDGSVKGAGVRVGNGLDAALLDAERGARDTLLGPILAQIRRQLARETRESALAGDFTVRQTGADLALVIPRAELRGTSGATLLSLSRFRLSDSAGSAPRFAGGIATGGPALPRIVGSVALTSAGGVQARLTMAEYRAEGSRLAIPRLAVAERPAGGIGFSGLVLASGKLPGGRTDNLAVPLTGNWAGHTLTLGPTCVPIRFDRLQYANVTLDRQALTLCPARGASMVRYDGRGLWVAVGAPALRVSGRLGQTPLAIRSGPIGFAYPGTLSARQLDVALGPPATAQRFLINDLTARIGRDISGRFAGTDVKLFAVPIDVLGAQGTWRYAAGRLSLGDASFRVEDRRTPARFYPLVARDADLALEDNRIAAHAVLREPNGGREVVRATLRHDLATGRGTADLAVGGVTFGPGFQPEDLSDIAKGKVALVRGTITGTGQIAWDAQGVTSTGRFSSDSLDFAAAFGPVKGASGTVEFTDLLALTTAPDQRIHVASVNPGIEVTDGEVVFSLRGGQLLAVRSGSWPFMGGTLTLRTVELNLGASEERRYVFEITGLDAARFIERMGLENISATGIFDGTVPVIFNVDGVGRIERGLLLSRPPGGNVAYVGALTYENMGAMANFAFDALRSLDYRQMRIEMNGNLTGEIVTNVRFDGVSQGAGAKQNFITRQIAKLPFRFDVNIRASFYQLLTNLKSLYDPAAVKDPRSDAVGLLDAAGNPLRRESNGAPPPQVTPQDLIPSDPTIQRRESED